MAARDKLNGPGAAAEGARARNWTGALGAAGAYFLTGFLMSAARIAGSAAPFGAAMVAQAGSGLNGIASLAGACLGYLAVGGLAWGIRYARSLRADIHSGLHIHRQPCPRRLWFMPVCAAAIMAATGLLGGLSTGEDPLKLILPALVEAVLSAGAVCFFREAMSTAERALRPPSSATTPL